MAELTVMLQMSQECLTGLVSIILGGGEASEAVPLVFSRLDLSIGSESPSDSFASSEEKSFPFEDLSQDELVDGVVDSELSLSTLLSVFRSVSLEPGLTTCSVVVL